MNMKFEIRYNYIDVHLRRKHKLLVIITEAKWIYIIHMIHKYFDDKP